MCDDEAFGFALGGLSKIYAIRILGCGNDDFLAFSIIIFHLLSKHIEDADHAEVFAFDADESVGGIGGKAESWIAFAYAVSGFIINGYGINTKVCVDIQCPENVFS